MYNPASNNKPICGLVTVSTVTGLPLAKVQELWPGGWQNLNSDRTKEGIPNDTPYDHFAFYERIGINYRKVECQDILNKETEPKKTAVLLHLAKKPEEGNLWDSLMVAIKGLFTQHWVVVTYVTSQTVFVDWGNGKIEALDRDEFEYYYSLSTPACAYEIDVPANKAHKMTKWEKFLAYWTRG